MWFVVVLCGVILLRIPSLFEPYWYGDEAIYLTLGQAMRKGLTLYSQIHDNKPPLLYVMAALANGNQFWFKFITMFWNLATITAFYWLVKKVFENKKKPVILSVIIFSLLTTLPLLEGNIANAELYFLLPSILTVGILWKQNPSYKKVFAAGLVLGMGGLFKMPVLIEAGVWPVLWLVTREKSLWKKTLIFGIGILSPILISVGYYFSNGVGKEYLIAAWAQNLPYLSSWKASSSGSGIYGIKGRIAILAVLLAVVAGLSRRIGRTGTLLGLWWMLGLFAALLSGRPYPHYLMQTSGPLALGIGILTWRKIKEKTIVVIMLGITLGAVWSFRFYGYPVFGYYTNFAQWIVGTKSMSQYFDWFNSKVNTNYEISRIVMAGSITGDRLFVWGDEPMVYAITKLLPIGKYTVAYHIKDLKREDETLMLLRANPPRYIVTYLPEKDLPGLGDLLASDYGLQDKFDGAKVFRRFGGLIR